jgi:hypothetical protein
MITTSILKTIRAVASLALFALLGTNAQGRDLLADYQKALQFDPQYQTALADLAIAQRGAKQAKSVFYPEATFNSERLATDTSTRTSLGVSQPLMD